MNFSLLKLKSFTISIVKLGSSIAVYNIVLYSGLPSKLGIGELKHPLHERFFQLTLVSSPLADSTAWATCSVSTSALTRSVEKE